MKLIPVKFSLSRTDLIIDLVKESVVVVDIYKIIKVQKLVFSIIISFKINYPCLNININLTKGLRSSLRFYHDW